VSAVDRFLVIFPSIVYEAIPFIILGALISGTLEELLPQQLVARLIPRRRWLAVAGSALLGLVFPMCECGIVPVMRRLLGKGLPLSCAIAYMLAAPIINPVVIASTWAAFSGDRTNLDGLSSLQMVLLRCGLGFVTAFTVGLICDRLARRLGVEALVLPLAGGRHHDAGQSHSHSHSPAHAHSHSHSHAHGHAHRHSHGHGHDGAECAAEGHAACGHGHDEPAGGSAKLEAAKPRARADVLDEAAPAERKTLARRLVNISGTALHDFVDITCFLVLGAFLAALVQTFNLIQYAPGLGENPVMAVFYMMVMAVLLCLCSEADAFVAANLIKIPLGGKVAFLVLGPMLDLKLYMMYTRVFKPRLIWTIIGSVVTLVFILSVVTHFLHPAAGAALR
jgi:hypothetical protein